MDYETVGPFKTVNDLMKELREGEMTEMTSVGTDQQTPEAACNCSGCTCGAERESSDNTQSRFNPKH